MNLRFSLGALALWSCLVVSTAHAEELCGPVVTRSTVTRCALRASLQTRAQERQVEAARAQKEAASTLLPSNPVLAFSAARRDTSGSAGLRATNWYATVSQELEIAGQRGTRRAAAEANVRGQAARLQITRRDVASDAWVAYFDALAARERVTLSARLAEVAQKVATAARARADKGLLAPVEGDVAEAEALRVERAHLEAQLDAKNSTARLGLLLGLSSLQHARAEGELIPLPEPARVTSRPELTALAAEREAASKRADAYRRQRIVNPTLSVFAQNDGFDERVFGAGVAFPVPLPGNVGRTYRGEIAESEATARKAEAERELASRTLHLERVVAEQHVASAKAQLALFTSEHMTRAEQSLRDLAASVESGRLAVRDAVIAQQSLIELLRDHVEAQRDLCLASVELAVAAGVALEEGGVR